MTYCKSLLTVAHEPLDMVGERARDLALLQENKLKVPPSFVVFSSALDRLIELNNLKYKIDYMLTHTSVTSASTLVNAYNSVRKMFKEAKLPEHFEEELKEIFDGLTAEGLGLKSGAKLPVRIILSPNVALDSENNDTVIQDINGWNEFIVAVQEAFALAYHPSQIRYRVANKIPEQKLKVALIVQIMEDPTTCAHGYSCLPQDRHKVYLQTYYGNLDLRNKVTKDYYALSREGLEIVSSEIRAQDQILERDERLMLSAFSGKGKHDKLIDREVQELARLTKKAERLLQAPVKVFFSNKNESQAILFVNRLGFDSIPDVAVSVEEDYVELEAPQEEPQIVAAPEPTPIHHVKHTAKLLEVSLRLAKRTVEQKYKGVFGIHNIPSDIGSMLARLNETNALSKKVDAELLKKTELAIHDLTPDEEIRAASEIAFLLSYA